MLDREGLLAFTRREIADGQILMTGSDPATHLHPGSTIPVPLDHLVVQRRLHARLRRAA